MRRAAYSPRREALGLIGAYALSFLLWLCLCAIMGCAA